LTLSSVYVRDTSAVGGEIERAVEQRGLWPCVTASIAPVLHAAIEGSEVRLELLAVAAPAFRGLVSDALRL